MKRLAVTLPALLWTAAAFAQSPSAQDAFNVLGIVNVLAYNAYPDTRRSLNCAGTINGSTFSLDTCAFFLPSDAADGTHIIKLMWAGGLYTGTIAGYVNPRTVQLSSAPTGDALNSGSVWVYVGHDYHAQIQAASDAAAAMGATLYFPPGPEGGCYGIAGPISLSIAGPPRWRGGLSVNGCGIANLGTRAQMMVGTAGVGIGQTPVMIYRPLGSVAMSYTTSLRDLVVDGTGDASPLRMDQTNRCDISGNTFKGAPAGSSIVQMGDGTNAGNAEGCRIESNDLISENGSDGQPVPSNPWFHASPLNNPLIGLNDLLNTSDGKISDNYFFGLSGRGSAGAYIGGGGWFVGPNNHEANGTGFHTDYGYNIQGVNAQVHGSSCDTAGIACILIAGANASVVGNKVQGTDGKGIEIADGVCGAVVIGNTFPASVAAANAVFQDGKSCVSTHVRFNGRATYTR